MSRGGGWGDSNGRGGGGRDRMVYGVGLISVRVTTNSLRWGRVLYKSFRD